MKKMKQQIKVDLLLNDDTYKIGINNKYYPFIGAIKGVGFENRSSRTEYWYSKVNNLSEQVIEKIY